MVEDSSMHTAAAVTVHVQTWRRAVSQSVYIAFTLTVAIFSYGMEALHEVPRAVLLTCSQGHRICQCHRICLREN